MGEKGINKKYNKFEFYDDYCVGITNNNETRFIIDLKDYDKIKHICWVESCGYIDGRDCKIGKKVRLHNYILDKKHIDHIDNNPLNNRKYNLRECTQSQNSKNQSKPKNSKCEFMGVSIEKGKYNARIGYNKKKINLGSYDNINDAIIARLKAEKEYFGEFAPQRDLFEKYNI